MNEAQEKIRAMIKEETATKRREELDAKRKKKKVKKTEVKKSPLSVEKKKLFSSLFYITLFTLFSIGLFYGASISKKNVTDDYQQKLETKALIRLEAIMTQAILRLSHKINNFNYILRDAEYIKNFNDPSWQAILKTELSALLGDQAIVEIIPADYTDFTIIDKPGMGYAVLALLDELKKRIMSVLKAILKLRCTDPIVKMPG